jgi:DNA-binding LacI/PurR family transcriptional regulator
MNDLYALLVLQAAEQAGLNVPEELAVVGFVDLDFASTLNPPLTTVAQQPYQLGMEAARLLLAWIDGERGPVRQIRLPTRLVVRESSTRFAAKGQAGGEVITLQSSSQITS